MIKLLIAAFVGGLIGTVLGNWTWYILIPWVWIKLRRY
jgi:hypothetical protein